jgi:hypothetical protein
MCICGLNLSIRLDFGTVWMVWHFVVFFFLLTLSNLYFTCTLHVGRFMDKLIKLQSNINTQWEWSMDQFILLKESYLIFWWDPFNSCVAKKSIASLYYFQWKFMSGFTNKYQTMKQLFNITSVCKVSIINCELQSTFLCWNWRYWWLQFEIIVYSVILDTIS